MKTTQISRQDNRTPIYYIGLVREGRKLIIQAKESIDDLSCEITDYLGVRQVSKATIEANKEILLAGFKALPKYRNCDMVVVEEPEEEYKRPEITKYAQIAYLERMQRLLTALHNAMHDLSREWDRDMSYDLDMNNFLADQYPFNFSFDELTLEADVWYQKSWVALNRKIKVLQGYPVEKVYGNNEVKEEDCEYLKKEVDSLAKDHEVMAAEIRRLRGIIRSARYYVLKVWGDVEPSLSREFNNEEARDEEAKRMRKEDTEENEQGYSGIYWLNIIRNELVIGSYSGIFFGDEQEEDSVKEPFIVIEKQDPEWPVIVTDETGQPKIYETLVCAKIESDMCQNGQVVAMVDEPPAPYYTPEQAEGKWICAYDTMCGGWDCVRYSGGEQDGLPVLYNSQKEVETDDFFDGDDDFAIPATEFIEGRKAIFGGNGLHITGTPIVKGYKIEGGTTIKA